MRVPGNSDRSRLVRRFALDAGGQVAIGFGVLTLGYLTHWLNGLGGTIVILFLLPLRQLVGMEAAIRRGTVQPLLLLVAFAAPFVLGALAVIYAAAILHDASPF